MVPFLEVKLGVVTMPGAHRDGRFARARTKSGLPMLWDHLPSPIWGAGPPHHPLSRKTVVSSACSFSHGW